MPRAIRLFSAAAAVLAIGALSACAPRSQDPEPSIASVSGRQEFVTVVFDLESWFGDHDLLDTMWPTEERAIEALEIAGVGSIDGNSIGDSEYVLYFYGDDRREVWRLIEPIMRDAPVPLSRVELSTSIDDASPDVIEID